MAQKAPEEGIKILIISKGFGDRPNRLKTLQTRFKPENVTITEVPEPSVDVKGGLSILEKEIQSFKPTLIIGSSRGGYYISFRNPSPSPLSPSNVHK